VFDAVMVSEHFWPAFKSKAGGTTATEATSSSSSAVESGDAFMHPRALALETAYADAYAVLQKPRHLVWRREQVLLIRLYCYYYWYYDHGVYTAAVIAAVLLSILQSRQCIVNNARYTHL
jgi:hypothetical protein